MCTNKNDIGGAFQTIRDYSCNSWEKNLMSDGTRMGQSMHSKNLNRESRESTRRGRVILDLGFWIAEGLAQNSRSVLCSFIQNCLRPCPFGLRQVFPGSLTLIPRSKFKIKNHIPAHVTKQSGPPQFPWSGPNFEKSAVQSASARSGIACAATADAKECTRADQAAQRQHAAGFRNGDQADVVDPHRIATGPGEFEVDGFAGR